MADGKFAPMLAETVKDLNQVKYPCFVQRKLDGIRCLITIDGPVTRNLKPIPNKKLRELLNTLPIGLDGELLYKGSFQETSSHVMTQEGTIDGIEFHVFDIFNVDKPYIERDRLLDELSLKLPDFVKIVTSYKVNSKEEVLAFEEIVLGEGYEGVILRSFDSGYKYGRSTLKQQWLLKYKQFQDAEAIVIGSTEFMHNQNEATRDVKGDLIRSSEKAGMVPAGVLGALIVRLLVPADGKGPGYNCEALELRTGLLVTDVEFQIGSGFTHAQREELWKDREALIDKIVKFKSFVQSGVKDKPRFPVFLGFRDRKDL